MNLELEGKVAIITGGSKGIGKAIAYELANEGVDLALCARTPQDLMATTQELREQTGRKVIPITADTTKTKDVQNLVDTTLLELGKIDILINNAAMVGGQVAGTLNEANEKDLIADLDTKVVGYFRCIKAVAPHMQTQQWGRIINIGGTSARYSTLYGMRNAAVAHMTKTLSDQLGPYGITINVVHPGSTLTEGMQERLQIIAEQQGMPIQEVHQRNSENVAIRRGIKPEELAYLVAFLVSPKAECITGEMIAAGGGIVGSVFQ